MTIMHKAAPEETKRRNLTIAAVVLWTASAAYASLVAAGIIPNEWGVFTAVITGAAATVSVVRLAKSTRYVLAQVYRAGVESERQEKDAESARSFTAGLEAGRYLAPNVDNRERIQAAEHVSEILEDNDGHN